jgi:hypothetical protein
MPNFLTPGQNNKNSYVGKLGGDNRVMAGSIIPIQI